jgi:D-alanyl-D-alanine carboxypeptidase/D-alanyl-D-alanine-endopeptidase (penicillin-binding protein 4)
MRRTLFIVKAILIIAILPLQAQWQSKVDKLLLQKDLNSALFAIQVMSAEGEVLYERNPHVGVMPASTLKMVTTLSALGIMGPKYKYRTVVGYKGSILEDCTLYGDLVLIGSGDPSFGSDKDDRAVSLDERLNDITTAIEENISCVEGKLLVDATIFDNEAVHPGWAWDDLSNYYATGIWGLNIHENLFHLSFSRSSTPGSITSIGKIEPHVNGLQILNEVRVGAKGSHDEAFIYGDPYEWKKQIHGTIPPGLNNFKIKGAIPDSRLWFAQLLKDRLQSRGISVSEIEVVERPIQGFEELASFNSVELRELIQHANEVSDNLYCDVFLKTIGAKYEGMGTWKSGQEGLISYFKKSKITTTGYHQEDGSGLTMRNRVSASFMTEFLLHHVNKLSAGELKYLLPQAGVNGSVKNFLNGYESQSHAWLKSGSINAVVAYTGILEIAPMEHVLIYIASNGHTKSNRTIRSHIERIIDTVYQGLSSSNKQ